MFLIHHHQLLGEVTARKAAGTMDAERERLLAASMKLSVKDFEALGAVYDAVQRLLDAVDCDADAYRDKVLASGSRADPRVYQTFTARKTAIESTIKPRIKAMLAPAAWKGSRNTLILNSSSPPV